MYVVLLMLDADEVTGSGKRRKTTKRSQVDQSYRPGREKSDDSISDSSAEKVAADLGKFQSSILPGQHVLTAQKKSISQDPADARTNRKAQLIQASAQIVSNPKDP